MNEQEIPEYKIVRHLMGLIRALDEIIRKNSPQFSLRKSILEFIKTEEK